VSTTREALEALTDEGLEQGAEVRGSFAGGELGETLTVPLTRAAGVFAAEVRLEFPGRDRENARVLAAVAAKLDAAGERLADAGLGPGETVTALLAILSLAADDLNQDGAPR
jgi:hypothetical protein